MDTRRRRAGLVVGLFLLLALGGASLYAYGTTTGYIWVTYGVPPTLPPARPLSMQILRGLGAALAIGGMVGAAIAARRLIRLRAGGS